METSESGDGGDGNGGGGGDEEDNTAAAEATPKHKRHGRADKKQAAAADESESDGEFVSSPTVCPTQPRPNRRKPLARVGQHNIRAPARAHSTPYTHTHTHTHTHSHTRTHTTYFTVAHVSIFCVSMWMTVPYQLPSSPPSPRVSHVHSCRRVRDTTKTSVCKKVEG
jgi:hypothetical protein